MEYNQIKDVSIVIPAHNEERNIRELCDRIKDAIPARYSWEIIIVDDGSSDRTNEVIREVFAEEKRIRSIVLSRNYGHQVALTAGYDTATGKVVITMDADLQHPPELIPGMLELWGKGFEVVLMKRVYTEDTGWFKRLSSKLFYSLLRKITHIYLEEGVADFRLIDRKGVNYLRKYRESGRFIRGIINDMGFKRTTLEYEEPGRKYGESKYTIVHMIRFAISGITSFSIIPLRISMLIGSVISLFSILYAFWIVSYKFLYGVPTGIASVLIGIFFLGGIQLMSIGILGEYIASIYNEVKNRPLYCIKEIIDYEENISHGD
ncbi:MAG: glycosyltransferase family 2 protein [Bacteroidetes bacterium]|nr:glycosyltransferase family 2 protein [Bacteroidota bacterium]